MKVLTLVVGSMQSNCYILFDEKTKECVIIDPGDDSDFITTHVLERQLSPIAVIATHGHFDHVSAALAVKTSFGIPFMMNTKDNFLLERMKKTAEHFLGTYIDPAPLIDTPLVHDSKLVIGDNSVKVISTPGHTPGSVSLYVPNSNMLFVGDLVFADYRVGRTDLSYSKKQSLWDSIRLICALPDETRVYSGHGDETIIAEVKKILYH